MMPSDSESDRHGHGPVTVTVTLVRLARKSASGRGRRVTLSSHLTRKFSHDSAESGAGGTQITGTEYERVGYCLVLNRKLPGQVPAGCTRCSLRHVTDHAMLIIIIVTVVPVAERS
jgi:hypothetical protein